MPTRVTVPEARHNEVMSKLAAVVAATGAGVTSGMAARRREALAPLQVAQVAHSSAGGEGAVRGGGAARRAGGRGAAAVAARHPRRWSTSCWRCCSPSRIAWAPTAAACASTSRRRSRRWSRGWSGRSISACTALHNANRADALQEAGGRDHAPGCSRRCPRCARVWPRTCWRRSIPIRRPAASTRSSPAIRACTPSRSTASRTGCSRWAPRSCRAC